MIFIYILQIVSSIFLNNQRYGKIKFDLFFNSLFYYIIFISFSWDNIYIIIKGKGNDSTNYFIYKKHELCEKHNSTSCSCKLNMTDVELSNSIRNSIIFYKICTTFYEIINGKIIYIDNELKIAILYDNKMYSTFNNV